MTTFLRAGFPIVLSLLAFCLTGATPAAKPKLNVLLITADDLNWNATGVTGCQFRDITPNIDRLASEGLRFERAHVATALCGPSRKTMMTGRYDHRNGGSGFEPIGDDVPTLGESLRQAGYLNAILGKVNHITPEDRFCWDVKVPAEKLRSGRDPDRYYEDLLEILTRAREEKRPFFVMANAHDPHRPFPSVANTHPDTGVERVAGFGINHKFSPDEVQVPTFLPDLPVVREELAAYYTAVRRCDKVVGAILKAVDDADCRDTTLVMFLSDNGMPFPFAKCSCYPHGTRTPWIVRWPGKVAANRVDSENFIATIDFAPTVLEAIGLPQIPGMDGRSFLPLLEGKPQEGRDCVFTTFDQVTYRWKAPTRAATVGRYLYIYNAWYGQEGPLCDGRSEGRTLPAMQEAAKTDPAIAQRVQMLLYRVPDELYDVEADPNTLHNLVHDPGHQQTLRVLRERLHEMMANTADPWLAHYREFVARNR